VDAVLAEWVKAGGDPSDATIEPSALWITGILEWVASGMGDGLLTSVDTLPSMYSQLWAEWSLETLPPG
jgi:hypothetical protein